MSSSWSSEQLKFSGEDFDYDIDYLLFGKYDKLNSHPVSNCHSGQSSVYNISNSMTMIMNPPFCLPNPPQPSPQHHPHNPPAHRHSMHPVNSILPPSQPMIAGVWRNTDLCLDNFNYTTGSLNMNQLCEDDVNLSRNSVNNHNNSSDGGNNNHSDEYLHDDSDVEPKLNLSDPLMTDIAVGDLDDNSPISTNEYEMLLMPASSSSTSLSLSSSSSSSNGYNGCYSHPNSVCSTPTEVDLFNSSIPTSCSTNYTNMNSNNNNSNGSNNSNLASTMECGSTSSTSSSSSTSSGSCRSFQSSSTQQLYNCGNSLKTVKRSDGGDKLLYRSTDPLTTTISPMNKTPSPVVTAAAASSSPPLIDEAGKQRIEQSSDENNHTRRSQQPYEECCGVFASKSHCYNKPPVWQMRFNRKQQQHNQQQPQQHSNNSPSVSLLTRFRHHHHHHPSSVNHQTMKRRFTSPLKKVTLSSTNQQSNSQMFFMNADYSTPPVDRCSYSSTSSPIPLQMTNNHHHQQQQQRQGGGGENIPFPSHQHDLSSTYTFQLSPSLSECHYNEKAFYYNNNTTTTNNNNMSSMLNGNRKDNFLSSDWLKNEKHDLSCVNSTPLSSSKSISNMNNTASTHSITTTSNTTPTTGATATTTTTNTNSVVCKSPSRNYSITPPNPVQKRLHLLQFISKILQYSSSESPLFTPGASSSSSTSSSLPPTSMSSSHHHHHHRSSAFTSPVVVCSSSSASVSVSSSASSSSPSISTPFYPVSNQQDELIPQLFTMNSQALNCVQWIDKQARIFQIRNPQKLSQLWGYYRKNENMTFESVSRSLRLYYVSGKLERIRGQRNQYRFLDVNI